MDSLTGLVLGASEFAKIAGIVGLIILGIVALVALLLVVKFARLWLQAYFSRADVKLSELIGMWLRKVDARTIVLSKITAVQAGLAVTTKDLESHYLAGGRVPNVVRALIAANRANIELSLQTATAIDLAGPVSGPHHPTTTGDGAIRPYQLDEFQLLTYSRLKAVFCRFPAKRPVAAPPGGGRIQPGFTPSLAS